VTSVAFDLPPVQPRAQATSRPTGTRSEGGFAALVESEGRPEPASTPVPARQSQPGAPVQGRQETPTATGAAAAAEAAAAAAAAAAAESAAADSAAASAEATAVADAIAAIQAAAEGSQPVPTAEESAPISGGSSPDKDPDSAPDGVAPVLTVLPAEPQPALPTQMAVPVEPAAPAGQSAAKDAETPAPLEPAADLADSMPKSAAPAAETQAAAASATSAATEEATETADHDAAATAHAAAKPTSETKTADLKSANKSNIENLDKQARAETSNAPARSDAASPQPAQADAKPAQSAATPSAEKTNAPDRGAQHDPMAFLNPSDTSQAKPAHDLGLQALGIAPHVTGTQAVTTPVVTVSAAAQAIPVNALAVEIASQARAGNSRFEIRLDPPELGRIDVRLDIDRDGNVTSRLVVERADTYDLLRRDQSTLERALQQAGLRTSDNALEFSLRDQSFANQRQGDDQDRPRNAHQPLQDEIPPSDAVNGYARLLNMRAGLDIRV